MYKFVFSSLLSIISITLFNSCSDKPKIDDSKVFRLNRYDNISSLDPAFARNKSNNWAANLIYSGLVDFDSNLDIIPSIAKDWDISSDGKTYTFHLNKDIYFHKHPIFGEDSLKYVTAQDFVYSFNRLKDPSLGSSGGFVLNNVHDYTALNDSTFQINLVKPFPPFLGILCMKYCSVVPKEIFDTDLRFSHPIGTGPFKFKYWEENIKLVLKKNELYYKKDSFGKSLPYLDYINITFLPEKYAEFLQFLNGEIDLLNSLDKSYKDELLTSTGKLKSKFKDDFRMLKAPYLNTEYLCFYQDKDTKIPLELRKIIDLAIDKDKMIKYIRNGIGYAANGGFIPKGLPGHQTNIKEQYNTTKAKSLLVTYQQKNQIQDITLVTTQEYAEICEFIQSELSKIGLPIKVNVVDPATLRDGKANGKFDFFRANWGADYPDAQNFLSLFYSKNLAPNGPNYSHFKNSQFDKLYEESLQETNLSKRLKIYQELDSIVISQLPVIPTFYDESVSFIQNNIKGYAPNAIDMLDLTHVSKQEQ